MCRSPERRTPGRGAEVSCIPDAVEAELAVLSGNGWDPSGLAARVSLDEKPILAQPQDRPMPLITKYHL